MKENYYRILGLNNFASSDEIKLAYRKLAKKYHPDKPSGSEERFKRISEAYQKLQDPHSKEIVDNWIRRPKPQYASQGPRYSKRTAKYTSEKTGYSKKVRLYGLVFTLLFLTLAISLPLFLSYRASNYHYQEGLRLTREKNYYEATVSLNNAITWSGQRTDESSIFATRLSLYKLKSIRQAKMFINKGLEFVSDESTTGELHYLMGKTLKEENNIKGALSEWDLAKSLNYNRDSISFELGMINAFYLEEYEKAIENFEAILRNNDGMADALFGKAWSTQKLNRPLQSIKLYNELLTLDSNYTLGYFYRGHNKIVLGDTTSACLDFRKSLALGYAPAQVYLNLQCQDN